MRWSVRSTAVFALFAIGILAGLNIAGRIPVNGPTEPMKMRAAFTEIAGKDAISLGGSVGTAIDFDAMCLSGARFWNNGQDLFETEALVDLVLAQPDPPTYFFLASLPGTLVHDNGLAVSGGSYRRRYTYQFLHGEGQWGLIGSDWRQAFLSEAMPSFGDDLRVPWHQAMLRWVKNLPPPDPAVLADTASVSPEAAAIDARARVAGRPEKIERAHYFDPYVEGRTEAALRRIHGKVRESGGTLIIVETPVVQPFIEATMELNREEATGFAAMMERMRKRGAVTVQGKQFPAFSEDYAMFRDVVHLNAPGAAKYSRRLAKALRAKGLLTNIGCNAQ